MFLGRVKRKWDGLLEWLDPPSLHQWAAVEKAIAASESVLDLGCGRGAHIKNPDFSKHKALVGLDASADWTAELPTVFDDVIIGELPSALAEIPTGAFDAVIAIDVIEHFDKAEGEVLLSEMMRIAKHTTVVATPNGFVPQPPAPDNPFNEHLSGWCWSELTDHGFSEVTGHFGLKWLRGSYGIPTVRPSHLGYFLSSLTARFTKHFPELSYQLVAVAHKDVR